MRQIRTTAGKGYYRWDYQELRFLVFVLTKSKDFQETLNLFLDLHTHKEMSEIIRRVIIASMLVNGKKYQEIQQVTGASSATVSRIQQKLQRQKTILPEILKRTGDYEKFAEPRSASDPIQKRLDQLLTRATFGAYKPQSRKIKP